MGILESMVMSGMSSAIFVNRLVVCAVFPAAGFLAVVFFVIGAVDTCVMLLAIPVGGFVVRAILFAVGPGPMVFSVVGAVYSGASVSVMAALMVAVGISGAAGSRNQQADGEQ